jgi:hypothetical protein
MPLHRWQAPHPETPFAPSWTVPLFTEQFANATVNEQIRDLVLSREAQLKRSIEPVPISGIADGLTARWHGFNVFAWQEPCMTAFRAFVKAAYLNFLSETRAPRRRAYIQGWANVVRTGENLTAHAHDQGPHSYLSGNYCVAAHGTATVYFPPYLYKGAPDLRTALTLPNQPGVLTLFPSGIFHATTPNQAPEPRISLAFDIHVVDADPKGRKGPEGIHLLFDDAASR